MIPGRFRRELSKRICSLGLLWLLAGCGTFEVRVEPASGPVAEAVRPDSDSPADSVPTTVTAEAVDTPATEDSPVEPALRPIPGLQVIALNWSGEMKGSCQSLMINYAGEAAIGPCKQSFRQMEALDDRYDHAEWWNYWVERFAPFESQTLAPLGQVHVQGLGHETASDAWKRAAAQWAELLWVEIETAGRSESWATALSWQEEMSDRPGYCGWLQVSTYGLAEARYGPCDGEQVEAQAQAWLVDDWEQFDAWYYSQQPSSTDSFQFYGRGLLEMSPAESADLQRWAEAAYARLILSQLTGATGNQD